MKIPRLLAVLVVPLLVSTGRAEEPYRDFFKSADEYHASVTRDQWAYVEGLADAFRYLSETAERYPYITRCMREWRAYPLGLMVGFKQFLENPAEFNKDFAGVDLGSRSAAEAFGEMSKLSCRLYMTPEEREKYKPGQRASGP